MSEIREEEKSSKQKYLEEKCKCGHNHYDHDLWGWGQCTVKDCGCEKFITPEQQLTKIENGYTIFNEK